MDPANRARQPRCRSSGSECLARYRLARSGSGPVRRAAGEDGSFPQFKEGKFQNSQKMHNSLGDSMREMLGSVEAREPSEPVLVEKNALSSLKESTSELRVTWLGHSTLLLEIAGKRFLIDPVFGPAASPFSNIGPVRWYPPPLSLEQIASLGKIEAVLLSHDHYDHLDEPTITAIADWDTRFIAPLGVGAHLQYWGVPAEKITDVDWGDELSIGGIQIVVMPSRHASGRHLFDQMSTLWAGYGLFAPGQRVYYSGDTGYFEGFKEAGEKWGPFDLVMVEIGAYNTGWPDWHMGPEQAVLVHRELRGKLFLPIHWGLFPLAPHGWTEPVERLWLAAEKTGTRLATPRPGQPILVDKPPQAERWWPQRPWRTAEEYPIVATKNGDPNVRYEHVY